MRDQDECYKIYGYFKEHGLSKTQEHYGLTKDQAWGIVYRQKERERKISSGVDAKKAESYRRKAIQFAQMRSLSPYAEDFASYCVIRLYEGKVSRMHYMLTDFKRKTFGEVRTKKGLAKVVGNLTATEIGESDDDTNRIDPAENEDKTKLFETVKDLTLIGDTRTCFLLHTLFGLKLWEIGLCLNLTESRVSQIISDAGKLLRGEC